MNISVKTHLIQLRPSNYIAEVLKRTQNTNGDKNKNSEWK